MKGRQDDFFILEFDESADIAQVLEDHGSMPLPPYIQRQPEENDNDRYQTVYAQLKGAVAAPTAGLHFDKEMLAALQHKGVQLAQITLHVGAGTFQPVRENNIEEHKIHAEKIMVPTATTRPPRFLHAAI